MTLENDVYLFEIIGGQKIVSKAVPTSGGQLALVKPRMVLLQQMPGTNEVSIQLISPTEPLFEAKEVTLNPASIVFKKTLTLLDSQKEKQLLQTYLTQVSGILPATSMPPR